MYNEKMLEYQRLWRKRNPEKYRECYTRYNNKHKEQRNKYISERRKNDPEWREKWNKKRLEKARMNRLMFKAYCSRPDIKKRLHQGVSKKEILQEYKELKKQKNYARN